MSPIVKHVRVVVVSPGDVEDERAATDGVVAEINSGIATDRGCVLTVWRWEADARPGLHLEGPQGLIDDAMDIEEADAVVGVFWKRFGTPTKNADSGTEHELRRAWAAWKTKGSPDVMVYFCTRPYTPSSSAETDQWGRVLDFKKALPEYQLWWSYESVAEFESLVRKHLTKFVLERHPTTPSAVAAASRVRFNLPPVAASFTGREDELDAIDAALGVADRAVITQAIAGLGGVGKSQLAARYVQTRADDFEIVAWIRAEDGGTGDLAGLAAKLGAPVEDLPPGERAKLALQRLGESDARWLLVLDNVDSAKELRGLLPGSGNGRVLVTSRDCALSEFGPVLAVAAFDEDTATAYLVKRAGRPRDEPAARKLAAALGCLPLALSHAAAYCRSGTNFTDYLELLDQLPARELFDTHPEESYSQTVASTWKASIAAASKGAPLAIDVLEMAAFLAPDAIPKSLFRILIDDDTPAQRRRVTLAFNALARFSLATVDDDAISVHRLLQRTVREDASNRGDDQPALRALGAMDGAFPRDYKLPEHWLKCQGLLAHALALSESFAEPGQAGAQLVGLLNRASGYLNRAQPGPRGLTVAKANLAHAERLLDTDHAERIDARETLAVACWAGGCNTEAIAIYELVLEDRERILGDEHQQTLTTRNNLGLAYWSAGRAPDAIAIYEPLLANSERILGPQDPATLTIRHNLALLYQETGRTNDAIAMYAALLSDSERILGPEHPDTLSTLNNLAHTYQLAGRTTEAIANFEPLLAALEHTLGPDHPNTLSTRSNLAHAYRDGGRIADAIAMYEALLTHSDRSLGPKHPYTLTVRHNLAATYEDAGRTADAHRLRQTQTDAP